MMGGDAIGIGIVGSGFMGRTHAEVIAKYAKGARLAAVAGGSRASGLARDYGLAVEPSVEALVARRDVHAVVVTSPHAAHAAHARLAAGAGKHVLIEKPMAASVEACDDVIAACRRAGVNCMVAFTQRYRKCNVAAKRLIDEGRIGKVLQARETMLLTGGMDGLPPWQNDPANVGTLFGHGIHAFDRLRWLTGSEIRTVYAKCGSLDSKAKVEGTSLLALTTVSGVVASFWCSFEVPGPGFPGVQFHAAVVGEKGLLDLDAYASLKLGGPGGWETVESQEPIDWKGKGAFDPVRLGSFTGQDQEFIDSIREGRPPAVTGWDGRQAVAAALAAYESSRTGAEIVLGVV